MVVSDKKKLGFGMMRLPMTSDNEIDIAQSKKMADEYVKRGFCYFDTAFGYIDGRSEGAVGECVVKRYDRDSYIVADKMPAWCMNSAEDLESIFNKQKQRTGLDYFDYYLLHAVSGENLDKYNRFGAWEWGRNKKANGDIKLFGFSFHDNAQILDEILTAHPYVDFVQLQINYIDWKSDNIQSEACYNVARKHGKDIIIMEPVKGGLLAKLHPELEAILKAVNPTASIASWAMRYAASLDGVIMVLSGMSTEEQMLDNIATLEDLKPFTQEEQKALDTVVERMLKSNTVGCTACSYCTDGCPAKIKIPDVIKVYNNYLTSGNLQRSIEGYDFSTKNAGKAGECVACGQCEGVCPQHLEIVNILGDIAKKFEQ